MSRQNLLVVVSNTSPLFYAAEIGQFDLFRVLYGQINIPDAVYEELVIRAAGLPIARQIRQANWIARRRVKDTSFVTLLQQELDAGEAESIALAKEMDADLLLIDERKGRQVAQREGISRTGICGVLVDAKRQGHLIAVKPILDALFQNTNFRGNQELYNQVLKQAKE